MNKIEKVNMRSYFFIRISVLRNYSIIMLLSMIFLSCSDEVVFYVSEKGSDKNPGTIEQPFATINKAIDTINVLQSSGNKKEIKVFIRGGTYFLEKEIRIKELPGKEKMLLTISAYNEEEVILSGSKNIPLNKMIPIRKDEVSTYINPAALDKIKQINLKELDIFDYGKLRNVGFATPYGIAWGELFINNKPLHLARWPNSGMIPVDRVFEAGSVPRDNDFTGKGGVIGYDSLRIDHWANEKDVWIKGYFKYSWGDDMLKIASIDTKKKTITTEAPAFYGFASGKPYNQWYGVNILAELDEPGEYYTDRKEGKLYFIPPEEQIKSIKYSILEDPFITIQGTTDLTINGIIFECSRGLGIAMDNTLNTKIINCKFRNLGSLGITVGKGIEPFTEHKHEGTGKPKSGIVGSLLEHIYTNTTFNRQGGRNNLIIGCEFYNMGAGGISMGGGNRLTLEAGNNVVENCVIHDLNRIERSYRPAIHLTGVGNIIKHCEVYNVANQAVLLHGNNHLIEYNYFHDVVLEAKDAGAIYYGRNPSERGIVIRYNYFENIPDDGLTMAIYADDGACDLTIMGNVFYKAGERVFMLGGGNDHNITNNIFIKSKYGIHVDNRLQQWAANSKELYEQRLKAVNYNKPPYSTQYPELVSYFNHYGLPTRNVLENNVFVDMGQMILYVGEEVNGYSKEKWLDIKDSNLEISHDKVGFLDWNKRDFSLKHNSIIYKKLPDFQKIPFYKIGTYKNKK